MILIQCTKSKRDEPTKAKDLYDASDLFCKMRAYAEAKHDEYRILSAKHGLVHPQDRIKPYDERGLSERQAEQIATAVAAWDVDTVEVVAGRGYLDPLIPELEAQGIDVINNFAGIGIGTRKKLLKERTQEHTNETLSAY